MTYRSDILDSFSGDACSESRLGPRPQYIRYTYIRIKMASFHIISNLSMFLPYEIIPYHINLPVHSSAHNPTSLADALSTAVVES
jgi:hypothetical protein